MTSTASNATRLDAVSNLIDFLTEDFLEVDPLNDEQFVFSKAKAQALSLLLRTAQVELLANFEPSHPEEGAMAPYLEEFKKLNGHPLVIGARLISDIQDGRALIVLVRGWDRIAPETGKLTSKDPNAAILCFKALDSEVWHGFYAYGAARRSLWLAFKCNMNGFLPSAYTIRQAKTVDGWTHKDARRLIEEDR